MRDAGFDEVRVRIEPAVWTAGRLSERGLAALHADGIAPPHVPPGKALRACQACGEPFEPFKPH